MTRLDLGALGSPLQEVLLELLAGGNHRSMARAGRQPHLPSRTCSLCGIIHAVPFLKPISHCTLGDTSPFTLSGSSGHLPVEVSRPTVGIQADARAAFSGWKVGWNQAVVPRV